MPKANKVRVTNIRLDSDSRIIGDKTWDLSGNNSIFLLENGGGKTSVIQLLHQVILPNHTIQKRKMSNGVKKGSTRHIAVEWISDDENYSNFVTGFCFHNYGVKQSDKDRAYDYFNYIFEYDEEDGLTLEELPFTQDGKVTKLDQLRSELSQTPGVHLFNTNREYNEALEQYGLLESEWENIAKVNGEEGGVTEFFDSTNKTVTLIERLLIPSLTDSIYDSPEERNAILESFKKYKSGLLELPELEKDLQDFEVILDHSDPIVDSFKGLEETMKDLEVAKENLTKLYVTVSKESSDNEELLSNIEESLTEMELQKQTLNWKLDSYKIHLLKEQEKKQSDEYDEKEREFEQLKREESLIKNNIKEQRAAKVYERYKVQNGKKNEVSSQLEVARLDAEKQNSEFIKVRHEISQKHQYLLDELMNLRSENKEELDKFTQGKVENQSSIEAQENEKSKLEKSIARLDARIEQYGKEKLSIQNKVGGLWEDDVSKTNENIKSKLEQLQNKNQKIEEELDKIYSDFSSFREGIVRLNNDIPAKEKELERAKDEFDLYAKEEVLRKEELGRVINVSLADDIFDDRHVIQFNLERKQKEFQKEHTKISVSLDHLIQLKSGIEQRGYHVHPEIEEVKEFLVQKKIGVISGVEWITNSSSSEEEKYDLLRKNPMLSFSILAELNQMNEIRNSLKAFKKELTVPIIFLDRLQLDNQEKKENFYAIEDNLFVFNQFNIKLTADEWETHTQELEEMIKEIKVEEQTLNERLDQSNQIGYKLQDFYKKYNKFSRKSFSKQVEQLEREVLEKTKEKQRYENDLVSLKEDKVQTEQARKGILKEINGYEQSRVYVQAFIERYADIESSLKEMESEQDKLETTSREIDKLKQDGKEIEVKQHDLQQVIEGIDAKVINFERDFNEYNYESTKETIPTDEASYEKAKSYYNQLRSESSVEQSQIKNLQQSLNTYQEMMSDMIQEIEKNSFTIEGLERIHITHDEGLLSQLELDHENVDVEIRELETSLAVLNNQKETTQKELNEELNKVEELYSEAISVEPYEYGQAAESEYQLHQNTKDSLNHKQEKLTKELEETKNTIFRINTALEELERRKGLFVRVQSTTSFEDGEWSNSRPMDDVHKYNNAIDKQQRAINSKEQKIQTNIWNLRDDAQKTGNNHLIHSIGQFIQIFEGSSYEETIGSFYKMLDGIDGYRQSLEARKKHSDESRSELIEQMYQRAEVIHKNIVDIAKSSQIKDDGEIINLINITWPKNEVSYAKHQLRTFVNSVLNELTELKKSGALEKEIDDKFDKLASLYNIVNCYAEVAKCSIRVLKPRNELLSMNKEYANWDSIEADWSGGERQIARISMFISFLNHLRKARFAKEMSWKFLVFDNPFDKIQSEHVVKPMIELAKRTNTQLLCFTGVNDRTIQQEFETVISNQYIQQHGSLLLSSEVEYKKDALGLETLFYSR